MQLNILLKQFVKVYLFLCMFKFLSWVFMAVMPFWIAGMFQKPRKSEEFCEVNGSIEFKVLKSLVSPITITIAEEVTVKLTSFSFLTNITEISIFFPLL